MDPARCGVVSHSVFNEAFAAMSDAGLKAQRAGLDWPDIEPQPGEYRWENMDRVVQVCQDLGVHLLVPVCYTPSWASGGDTHLPARDPAVWMEFVRLYVERYRGRVGAWSVWNEPNLPIYWKGSRRQFIDYWAPAVRLVRSLDPGGVIVGADLSSAGNNRCLKDGWMEEVLAACGDEINVISHHQYDGGDTPQGRLAELDKLHDWLARRGVNKPVWCTETGWSIGRKPPAQVSEQRQADNLEGMVRGMESRPWLEKLYWYDSHSHEFGLFDGQDDVAVGPPRPAFDRYRALAMEG